ncbi:conserved hypothetical protein [Trichinella spiralis]|uniref:hypothetical protein n=1 Tax=Trichinella spiralis TaxID=6334 RepID=UPI0001EFD119|nr:conserved hypothetical protein [Trichinella spiralis]
MRAPVFFLLLLTVVVAVLLIDNCEAKKRGSKKNRNQEISSTPGGRKEHRQNTTAATADGARSFNKKSKEQKLLKRNKRDLQEANKEVMIHQESMQSDNGHSSHNENGALNKADCSGQCRAEEHHLNIADSVLE